jgi:pre-mRNA-splicing helicase BRR2
MIDVSVNEGFLKTTLGVIKLLQCAKQAMWDNHSPLLMLPHLKAKDIPILKLNNKSISNLSELYSLENRQLKNIFGKISSLSNGQLSDIVKVVKNLPYITLEFEIEGLKDKEGRWYMKPETVYQIQIRITPKSNGNTQIHTPYFHKSQNEGWFVIIGNESSDELWALRRTASGSRQKDRCLRTGLNFTSPQYLGQHDFNIFALSDGYCEFNFEIPLKIAVI